jgi:hypothetical protein
LSASLTHSNRRPTRGDDARWCDALDLT